MSSFPSFQHLNINNDPNWQVKTFTDIFLNIMSNFIPSETERFVPRDSPWITKPLKTLLNKKNRLFKYYKKHGYKYEDKVRLEAFRIECQKADEKAKMSYLTKLGNKVNKPGTSQMFYWKIINRVMNRCEAPIIPPLINNQYILNCKKKHSTLISQQCRPIINSSVLPNLTFLTNRRIDINSKSKPQQGSDGISGQMLLLLMTYC